MIEKTIPILVFLLMFIIGASLAAADFKRLKKQPKIILMATLGQVLLLPLAAWLLIIATQPVPSVAGGMLLVSLCPGGAMSNIYSLLAKANVALSVTLTAMNSLFSVVALPVLIATIFPTLFDFGTDTNGLIKKQSLQLFLVLLCPVLLGMVLRHLKPTQMIKAMPTLERMGALGLLTLLVAIFIQFQQQIAEQLSSLMVLAVLFSLLSLIIAYCLCRLLRLQQADEAAVIIEFPVRNLALTAMIAVSIFNNSQYLLFAAVFFVVQTPIMLAVIVWYRSRLNVTEALNEV